METSDELQEIFKNKIVVIALVNTAGIVGSAIRLGIARVSGTLVQIVATNLKNWNLTFLGPRGPLGLPPLVRLWARKIWINCTAQ